MFKRALAILIIAVITAGCGAQPKNTVLSFENVTLEVVTPFGDGDGYQKPFETMCASFEEKYKAKVINKSEQSTEEWKSGVLSSFASNTEPDVLCYFSAKDATPFVTDGKVVSVDTIRSEYKNYAVNIALNVLNSMRAADGMIYAIPVIGYWEGMYINRDLFDENGVDVPDTWGELLEAVNKFKAVGIIPVAVSLGEVPHYWFEFLTYNYTGPSGHLYSVPTSDNLSMDYWGRGLNDFKELYEAGAFPNDTNTIVNADAVALFDNKKAAMLVDGSWQIGSVKDSSTVEVVYFPAKTDTRLKTDLLGGFSMGFYISKKAWDDTAKRGAAVAFVEHMISDEGMANFGAGGGAIPVSKKIELGSSKLMESVAVMQSQGTAFTPNVQDTVKKDAREQLFKRVPGIVTGEISVEDALKEFVELNK